MTKLSALSTRGAMTLCLTLGLTLGGSYCERLESAGGPTPGRKLTIVYSVNNSGYIDVCGCKHKEVKQGSLTRRASFLKQLRSTGRKPLLIDGGSTLFPIDKRVKDAERRDAVRKAELIVEAYNRMGYDAMAVGAFDLAAGLDTLLELRGRAKFPLLSANLYRRDTGKRIFEPSRVIEVEGVRVGLFGLTLETLSKVYLAKVAPGIELRDPLAAARERVADLRERTDIIVALSHVREETNREIARKLPDIDFLLDPYIQYGNHHTWIKEEEWVSLENETVILRGDGQGARLGVLELDLPQPGGEIYSGDLLDELAELVKKGTATEQDREDLAALEGQNLYRFTRASLEPHLLTDPDIDHLVDEWKKNIDPREVRAFEKLLTARDRYTTHEKCRPCHETQYAFWKGTAHSHAWQSLVKSGDQHRYDCVGCHALGYGQAFLDTSKVGNYADVQCESCHGQRPGHGQEPEKRPYGKVGRKVCIGCHNKAQLRKEFDYFHSRKRVACPASTH